MSASFPHEVAQVHHQVLIYSTFLLSSPSWAQDERMGLLSLTLPFQVINDTPRHLCPQSFHYIYIRVCVVCLVRVCVCDPDMALLAPFLNTPVSLSRSLNALFFVFVFFVLTLRYLGFIILLSTHPGLRSALFTLQSLWRYGKCVFIFLYQKQKYFFDRHKCQ